MTKVTIKELQRFTVDKLREKLKIKGLKTKGRKRELIDRLLEADKEEHKVNVGVNQTQVSMATKRTQSSKSKDLNGSVKETNEQQKMSVEILRKEREEREKILLWRHPFVTLQFCFLETCILLTSFAKRLWTRKKIVLLGLITLVVLYLVYNIQGSHQKYVSAIEKTFLWCAYWVGLGILSSVGLGTGLHTFLLYLGPHIAAVTLAAYECMSTDFPEPPYPTEIVCPEEVKNGHVSIWTIMSKVRLEAVMWGAGTALGELPPYFMARAARLSGADLDDDEFEEIEELLQEKQTHPEDMATVYMLKNISQGSETMGLPMVDVDHVLNIPGFMEKAKLGVHNLVQKVGFLGILACASIPNPLFDLAGITCGHFLIPFWTFFGATLIGKAIIKMHIQQLFVIFMFSEQHVEQVVNLIGYIPAFGKSLQTPFKNYLDIQKKKLHHKPGTNVPSESNLLGWIFEKVIIVMVAYFVLSIINSTAQSYHKRICKAKHKLNKQ